VENIKKNDLGEKRERKKPKKLKRILELKSRTKMKRIPADFHNRHEQAEKKTERT
jgi:hypothetical protein